MMQTHCFSLRKTLTFEDYYLDKLFASNFQHRKKVRLEVSIAVNILQHIWGYTTSLHNSSYDVLRTTLSGIDTSIKMEGQYIIRICYSLEADMSLWILPAISRRLHPANSLWDSEPISPFLTLLWLRSLKKHPSKVHRPLGTCLPLDTLLTCRYIRTGKLQFTLKFMTHHTATDIQTNLRHQ